MNSINELKQQLNALEIRVQHLRERRKRNDELIVKRQKLELEYLKHFASVESTGEEVTNADIKSMIANSESWTGIKFVNVDTVSSNEWAIEGNLVEKNSPFQLLVTSSDQNEQKSAVVEKIDIKVEDKALNQRLQNKECKLKNVKAVLDVFKDRS